MTAAVGCRVSWISYQSVWVPQTTVELSLCVTTSPPVSLSWTIAGIAVVASAT